MNRRRFLTRLVRTPAAVFGLVILIFYVGVAVAAPWVAPYDANAMDFFAIRKPPSAAHWLGTDELGRDVLSRLVIGSRASLLVAFLSVSVSLALAVPVGVLAGFSGGRTDAFIMRIMDGLLAYPALLLALAIATVLNPGVHSATVAIAIVFFPRLTRFVRGQVLAVRQELYIEAAVAVGVGWARLLFKYILPNIASPLIVQASLSIASAVLIESALSFIGAGIQPPEPSWGNMLRTGMVYLDTAVWLAIAPGATLSLLMLAVNLLGDSLRDILEPRFRV